MARGVFIVLEGGEGCGKSTQCRLLADALRPRVRELVCTFEPGGTSRGVAMRAALLDDPTPLDPRAEALLMNADRAQHVAEVVAPAVARGATVVCDRHAPSSIVYQGVARGLGVDTVSAVCDLATAGVRPDRVIVLDVSESTARARRPDVPDRIELEGEEFHARVRAAYRDLAPRFGWLVIDGEGTPDEVAGRVLATVSDLVDDR